MNKTLQQTQSMLLTGRIMRKVPEITLYFWIIKLLTTAMGESSSDYLVYHINPYIAVILGGVGLLVSLVLQLLIRRYVPWIYWLAVTMVAIFGTMAADVIHIVLGIPLSETETFMDRPQTMFGSCFHHHCLVSQVLHDVHRRQFPRNSRYLNQLA